MAVPATTSPSASSRPATSRPTAQREGEETRRFVFVLLDRFTMMSFTSAIEPLRLANRALGRQAYEWGVFSADGAAATASNGLRIEVDGALPDIGRDDTIILCGGLELGTATTRPVLNWLRQQARRGGRIGAVCTAPRVLAQAGLLEGRRATVHWEHHDGMAEDFPEINLTRSVFAIDGNRLTAAGGTSPIDLMLALIADDLGEDVASSVADQLIHTGIRTDQDNQRLSIPTRIGVRHPKLAEVIGQMETHIEDPVSPADLAAGAGMSTRQLERLFRRYLDRSPKRYYIEIRLARARALLLQTSMSVIEVALASGFSSPSHFSKCYRAQYGATPYRERGTSGRDRQAEAVLLETSDGKSPVHERE